MTSLLLAATSAEARPPARNPGVVHEVQTEIMKGKRTTLITVLTTGIRIANSRLPYGGRVKETFSANFIATEIMDGQQVADLAS